MASRLSSLLVRDGLVGVKKMEQVFQRQVIYGGAIDSILLEMKLVPEERLVQYLSLANGLPPATFDETNVFDANAVKKCPEDVARVYGVAPLSVEGDALRVLVRDPVDLARLEELADQLEVPIQPLIVPEYRFHVVFDRAFGRQTEARFATLARNAAEATPVAPVGKPKTVIIEAKSHDEESAEHQVVDVELPPSKPRTKTLEFSTAALTKDLDEKEQARRKLTTERMGSGSFGAIDDAVDNRPTARDMPAVEEPTPPRDERDIDTAPVVRVPPDAVAIPRPQVDSADTPLPGPVATVTPPGETAAVDVAPLTVAEARAALAKAENRDEVFGVLLRAVRGKTWYAGLLTIQGHAAIGRIAIAGDNFDRDSIAQVLIPVDDARAFKQAVTSAAPYIGPIATGDPEVDEMLRRMGGVVPPSALLLPIAIKNRVVALAIGHRGADTLGAAQVSELLPLAGSAAEALGRIIVKAKSVGYRAADAAPAAAATASPLPVDDLPTRKHDRGGSWAQPTQADKPALDLGAAEVTVEAEEPESAAELLDIIEGADRESADEAVADALARPDDLLPLLAQRFPGKLAVDRYENTGGGRALRAAEHGPLLGLVVQMGSVCADLLIEKMKDVHRDVRYYATVCTAELRPRSALRPLVDRLFDSDYGVRAAAIEALGGYPARELEQAMETVRHALHAEDPKRVQAAANATAELADVKGIPDLLDALGREDEGSPHARRALVALTKQDFGSAARKWRGWWEKARAHHRIEWLIEGLSSKEEPLRKSAIEDLRRLTGEYFGYHFDLPRKDRDAARDRWLQWWNDVGRRRFLRAEQDERHRPTAVLPTRSMKGD